MPSCSLIIIFFKLFLSVLAQNQCGIQNVECSGDNTQRTIDGTCNNLNNPNWGTIFCTYLRLVPPKYADGEHSFPLAVSGEELPNCRNITAYLFTEGFIDQCKSLTLAVMSMGQLVAHDMSFTLLPNIFPPNQLATCCTPQLTHFDPDPAICANIDVPPDDPIYSYIQATCLPMFRTLTNRDLDCEQTLTYAEQLVNANSYLDLSIIYGHTYDASNNLRAFVNGELLVEVIKGHEYPPVTQSIFCPGLLPLESRCFRSGDLRIIQNPQLMLVHIYFIRNHNFLARQLSKINPHWNDEKLFQVARSINIGQYQYIVYYELLPFYIGRDAMYEQKLLYKAWNTRCVDDYDDSINPQIFNEFAQGAFRQFHSIIAGKMDLFNNDRCIYDGIVLRDYVDRPVILEQNTVFDGLTRGLTTQQILPSDIYYDSDFTSGMFIQKLRFGQDTRSIDIHRSRDHGIGSYNSLREYCGLPKATVFEDFLDVMTPYKMSLLKQIYKDVNDVDLVVGGAMEKNVKGTLAGPTFLCIMFKQFLNTRKGDRFWFENCQSGFTSKQLKEIRKSKISKIFCDNGDNITHMQRKAFLKPTYRNPVISCNRIRGLDITQWKETVV